MVRRTTVSVMLVALWMLPGCAPAPVRMLSEYAVTPEYSTTVVDTALRGRAVKIEVHGDPFGVPPAAFAGQIAAAMTEAGIIEADFVSHDGDALAPGFKVVWDFAPRGGLAPDEICTGSTQRAREARLPIDVYVGLCRDGKALTAVRAKLFYTDTQNSIEFMSLIEDAARALFPTQLPALRRAGGARLAPQVPHVAR